MKHKRDLAAYRMACLIVVGCDLLIGRELHGKTRKSSWRSSCVDMTIIQSATPAQDNGGSPWWCFSDVGVRTSTSCGYRRLSFAVTGSAAVVDVQYLRHTVPRTCKPVSWINVVVPYRRTVSPMGNLFFTVRLLFCRGLLASRHDKDREMDSWRGCASVLSDILMVRQCMDSRFG